MTNTTYLNSVETATAGLARRPRAQHPPSVNRRHPALLGLLMLLLLMLLGTPTAHAAEKAPAVLDGKRVNELVAPAVRLIVVNYSAQVLVYAPEVNEAAIEDWASTPEVLAQVFAGRDPEALALEALTKDPSRFLVKGATPDVRPVRTQSVGSGFVVTPDGYIVTNAHVVESESDQLKQGFLDTALGPVVKEIAADVSSSFGGSYDAATLDALTRSVVGFIAQSMEVNNVTSTVETAEGTQVPGQDKQFKTAKAEVVSRGEAYPGKDVALLKVEGKDLPTVPLGDDSTVDTGEKLYALGYPANVTFLEDFTQSSQSTATLTDGVVSAKKETAGGYTAIQTNATISGGNSGGPALDDSGRVVGITTAGLVSGADKTGGAYNFVVPVGVAREFLQRSNVTPIDSESTKLWRTALTQMDQRHYTRATATLKRLDSVNPGRPDVQARLRDADARIAAGEDETPSGPGALVIGGIVGAAVLLVLATVLLVLRRRRARPGGSPQAGLPPTGPPAGGWGAPPVSPAQGYGQGFPQGQFPQGQYAQGQFPQGQFPQGQFPQGQYAQGQFPQGAAPEGQYPQGQYPQRQFPQGQYPQGQYAQGQFPQDPYAPGQYSQGEGQFPQGQFPQGQFPQGQGPYGPPPQYGQPVPAMPGDPHEPFQELPRQGNGRPEDAAPAGRPRDNGKVEPPR
jgi:S1-C subfamily serine protease